MSNKEKRLHSRIPFEVEAQLSSKTELIYNGSSKNFSFGGMYLYCDHPVYLPSNHICDLKMFVEGDEETVTVECKCRCARTDDKGFAIRFVSFSRSQYELLKKIISKKASEPEKLFHENEKTPAFVISG